jgi:hypothetical protein
MPPDLFQATTMLAQRDGKKKGYNASLPAML